MTDLIKHWDYEQYQHILWDDFPQREFHFYSWYPNQIYISYSVLNLKWDWCVDKCIFIGKASV